MATNDMPIAYTALAKGTPVVSASGREFGVVEHVLEIPAEDLFDGIVVSTDDGLRFVDRDQIDEIRATRVTVSLTDEQLAGLSAPDAAPAYTVDPMQDSGTSIHDRFGRMFRRPHWNRQG